MPPVASILDRSLEMYFDMFALQERIAKRFPAFDRMRLVKYRKPS
jgi:hypothetical protein